LHNIDDATLIDYSEYGETVQRGDDTFRSSYVGVTSLPVQDGAKYLLKVSTW